MKWPSTIRLVLVAAAMVCLLGYGSSTLFAQAAPATPGATAAPTVVDGPGTIALVVRLVRDHIDIITIIIFLLSVVAMTFIVRGFIQAREAVMLPPTTVARIREMIDTRQYQQLLEFTEADPSFVGRAINPALKRAPQYAAMKEAMETSIGEQTADAFRRIEILNIIGNLGPLLGLLGTVLGMIQAFDAMNRAGGNANPALLAGGIATALMHTFLGLALAIPTLACFGILRTMTDRLTAHATIVSEEMLMLMKPNEAKPMANQTTLPPRPQVAR